jgi:hypothetical protein
MAKQFSATDIVDAATELFLATGDFHSLEDIAAKAGCSTGTIYKIMRASPGGLPRNLSCSGGDRAGRGASYGPSREYLRQLVLNMRAAALAS